MPMATRTRALLRYLHDNAATQAAIAAPPDKALLYAGNFFGPVWQEIEALRRTSPQVAEKVLLPDVLARVQLPGQAFPNLLAWAKDIDNLMPWKENGFIVWRALSGIFAANAVGVVSFYIGSGVTRDEKVFAATELAVLSRNPNIDSMTRDMLSYYQRCVQTKQADINVGFVGG